MTNTATLTNPIKVRRVKKAHKAGPRRGWEARALAKVQVMVPATEGVNYRPLNVAHDTAARPVFTKEEIKLRNKA